MCRRGRYSRRTWISCLLRWITEYETFIVNFINLHSKIKVENPFAMFFAGDFNGKSQVWWPDGDETPEGREIEDMLTSLGLSQVISEPTNFEPGKKPSCIDIIVTYHRPR